jgi:hypothetical protein
MPYLNFLVETDAAAADLPLLLLQPWCAARRLTQEGPRPPCAGAGGSHGVDLEV